MRGTAILWSVFVLGLASLGAGFLFPRVAEIGFVQASYYLIWLLVLVVVYVGARTQRIPADRWGWLSALTLGALTFWTMTPHFRMLADETLLLSVSRSLFLLREPMIPSLQLPRWPEPYIAGAWVPDRPLLFPFLVQIGHAISGYAPENAFRLNFVVYCLLLALAFRLARPIGGLAVALAVTLLVAAQPVIAIYATTGGFDTLALLLMALALVLADAQLRAPTPEKAMGLWCVLLLLCHARYESIFLALGIAAMVWRTAPKGAQLAPDLKFLLALTPFLLLPRVWQFSLTSMQAFSNGEGAAPFGAGYVLPNAARIARAFVGLDGDSPFPAALNVAALLLATAALYARRRGLRAAFGRRLLLPLAACFSLLLLFLAFKDGGMQVRGNIRYYGFLGLLVGLSPIALPPEWLRRHSRAVLAAALACFVLYRPVAFVECERLQRLAHKLQVMRQALSGMALERLLVIDPDAAIYAPFGISAVTPVYAAENASRIFGVFRKRTMIRDILWVRELPTGVDKPEDPWDGLLARFPSSEIAEIPFFDGSLRLRRLRLPEDPAPAPATAEPKKAAR